LSGTGISSNGAIINSNASAATISGNITLAAHSSVGGSNAVTISGVISGAYNFTKVGSSTYTLSGTNTYSGDTTISAGTLKVTVNDALGTNGSGTVIASGATLDLANVTYSTTETITNNGGTLSTSTGTSSYAGVMTLGDDSTIDVDGTQLTISTAIGDGSNGYGITKEGSGTLILSGASTFSGDLTISAGTVTMTGTLADTVDVANSGTYDVDTSDTINSLSGSGAVQIADSVTLTTGDAGSDTISGVISGAGNLTKAGAGTLTLSGTNTYTGSTTITAGTISVSSSANLGATPGSADADNIIFNGGTLTTTASFTLGTNKGITMTGTGTINTGAYTLTYGGVTTGSGNLTKTGSGTLSLGGANGHTGDLIISQGTATITGTLSDSTDVSVSSGAVYDVDATDTINSLSGAGNVEIASGQTLTTGDAGSDTISGVISGAGNLTKAGAGTLTLSGTNTFSGDLTISAGTVTMTGTLADTVDVINSGTYDVDTSDTIQSLSGSGAVQIADSVTLTTGDAGDDTISGVISGAGHLTKAGAGTLTLSGTNTFSGDLTISAGTVTMTGTLADTVDVINSGTYDVDASDTIQSLSGSGAVEIATGVTLTFGDANDKTVSGVISGAGNLIKQGSGTQTLSGTNTFTGKTTINAGTISISADAGLGTAP
ncbi:MAG: hypothetical protein EBW65_10380, partial [Gammaproteobacteria bacterium]|nr:hypothetical protein [Gammaproteobacteria bacterium]